MLEMSCEQVEREFHPAGEGEWPVPVFFLFLLVGG